MSRVLIARGASRAFTILLLGGAVQPAVAAAVPALGAIWLALVAVTAFAAAARPAGTAADARAAVRTGAAAALAGYVLILPLSYVGSGALPPGLVIGTGLTAVLVGGGAAGVSARLGVRTTSARLGEVAR